MYLEIITFPGLFQFYLRVPHIKSLFLYLSNITSMGPLWVFLVRLSLLTMSNPNQLCDVLLFVCSKMADETNLSSKLPVADRTIEV